MKATQPSNAGRKEEAVPEAPYYSPRLSRFVVSALYHEGKARKKPMTQLADELLRRSLLESEGWQKAESLRVAEEAASLPTPNSVA